MHRALISPPVRRGGGPVSCASHQLITRRLEQTCCAGCRGLGSFVIALISPFAALHSVVHFAMESRYSVEPRYSVRSTAICSQAAMG